MGSISHCSMVDKGEAVVLVDESMRSWLVRVSGDVVSVSSVGLVDTSRLFGLSFGDVVDINERRYTIARPSLLDVLNSVKRKAQIVIPKDSGVIVTRTGIRGGDIVVEAGAGSGALTIVLCHSIFPHGRVITYEKREDFAGIARKNVEAAGYSSISSIIVKDICKGIDERDVSAVVLDMPNPWDVLEHAFLALAPGGSLAVYVPSMNQLEKTVNSAREAGFQQIFCTETLEREMVVSAGGTRPSFSTLGHTGYILTARRF